MIRSLVLSLVVTIACSDSTHSGNGAKDAAAARDGEATAGRPNSGGAAGSQTSGGASGSQSSGGVSGTQGSRDASTDLDSGDAAGSTSPDGSAGTPGAGGSDGGDAGGSGGTVPIDTSASVLQRNKHLSRDGAFVQPTLTQAAVAGFYRETAFNAMFPGAMYATPLYLEKGPGNKGLFFAVTTGNDVFALDETTGAIVWQKNIGPSPTATGVMCGYTHPLGIISTPVIDGASGTIYVAGAIGTTSIARHEVHALSVMDGTERPGFPVVVSAKSGSTTFAPTPQNQRSALSLVNGILYVAYGGHSGDCGAYHGWVIAIDTKNPTRTGGWATLGQGEGIWAAGGLPSDGNGVFAVTGNNIAGVVDHLLSDSEEVVRITGLGVLDRSDKNIYFPAVWHDLDAADADFGSTNAVYTSVPGSKPANILVATSKAGHMYLLDAANLGGMGKELADLPIATGLNVRTAPAVYTTQKGVHVVLSMDTTTLCPPPGVTGHVVMSVLLEPGSPPKPHIEWCAPQSPSGPITAPIATTTDGSANPMVWFMNGVSLRAVDGDTGKRLYDAAASNVCSGIRSYTSPIAVKGRIVAAGDGRLCAWSVPH